MRCVTWLAGLGVLWLVASSGVQADTATAFQQGRDTAASGAAAASAVNATNATGNVPGYNTAPTEAGLWRDGKVNLSGDGLGKQAGCTTASTSGFNGKECDAINFLGSGRPEYPLTRTDALFNLSNGITKNNRDAVSGMNGGSGTGGCTTVEVKDPDLQSTEHCEEFLEPVDKRCPIGRVVTVDRDANYQCEVTSAQKVRHECHKKLTVTCQTPVDGCNATGVQLGSISSDMAWNASDSGGNRYITLGTIADNYWGTGVYDRTTTFNIQKMSDVSLFKIDHAWFDDWLWVKVNGTTVYVGPYGGDRLQLGSICIFTDDNGGCSWSTTVVYYTATQYGGQELSTSWSNSLDINIRPYLREGSNTIWMRTVVAGGGEGAIRMVTRQYCPPVCTDSWADGCTGYQ